MSVLLESEADCQSGYSCYHQDKQFLKDCLLVIWLGCRFLDTEVDGSNHDSISMLCPLARHFIRVASVQSAVK